MLWTVDHDGKAYKTAFNDLDFAISQGRYATVSKSGERITQLGPADSFDHLRRMIEQFDIDVFRAQKRRQAEDKVQAAKKALQEAEAALAATR